MSSRVSGVLLDLVKEDVCGLRIVYAAYAVGRDLFTSGGKVGVEVDVAVYHTRCWRRGEERQEGSGKEEVGA